MVIKNKKQRALAACEIWEQHNPFPQTELNYHNNYTLLVAVMLSAQTRDAQVNKCTEHVFSKVDSPESMLELGHETLQKLISTIGLYKQKAKNVIAMSQILRDSYAGQVPDTLEDLESLPGVGRKTANVVLNVAFDRPTMPVDTHVLRLSRRLGLSQATTPEGIEKDLMRLIEPKYMKNAHHWFILHGRYVCTSLRPMCSSCQIKHICPSAQK